MQRNISIFIHQVHSSSLTTNKLYSSRFSEMIIDRNCNVSTHILSNDSRYLILLFVITKKNFLKNLLKILNFLRKPTGIPRVIFSIYLNSTANAGHFSQYIYFCIFVYAVHLSQLVYYKNKQMMSIQKIRYKNKKCCHILKKL